MKCCTILAMLFTALDINKRNIRSGVESSVPDPDPDQPDPYVFGPFGSGSISQMYGSESFYHQAKKVRKNLIPTVL
jgi:hypothetical protein